jgi:hypothetical protein
MDMVGKIYSMSVAIVAIISQIVLLKIFISYTHISVYLIILININALVFISELGLWHVWMSENGRTLSENTKNAIKKILTYIYILSGFISAVLYFIYIPNYTILGIALFVSISIQSIYLAHIQGVLISIRKTLLERTLRLLFFVFYPVSIYTYTSANTDVETILTIWSLCLMICKVIPSYILTMKIRLDKININKKDIVRVLRLAWPFFSVSIASFVIFKSGVFIFEAGQYYKYIEIWEVLIRVVLGVRVVLFFAISGARYLYSFDVSSNINFVSNIISHVEQMQTMVLFISVVVILLLDNLISLILPDYYISNKGVFLIIGVIVYLELRMSIYADIVMIQKWISLTTRTGVSALLVIVLSTQLYLIKGYELEGLLMLILVSQLATSYIFIPDLFWKKLLVRKSKLLKLYDYLYSAFILLGILGLAIYDELLSYGFIVGGILLLIFTLVKLNELRLR